MQLATTLALGGEGRPHYNILCFKFVDRLFNSEVGDIVLGTF